MKAATEKSAKAANRLVRGAYCVRSGTEKRPVTRPP